LKGCCLETRDTDRWWKQKRGRKNKNIVDYIVSKLSLSAVIHKTLHQTGNYPNEEYMTTSSVYTFVVRYNIFYIVQRKNKWRLFLFKPLCPIPSHPILSKWKRLVNWCREKEIMCIKNRQFSPILPFLLKATFIQSTNKQKAIEQNY
jgi:hypothetical protein